MATEKKNTTHQTQEEQPATDKICGLIMPISPIDGCSIEHWGEVREILKEAILDAGYKAKLVSESDEVNIIQNNIINNIYKNELIVCDISGKNPNVMFELGMRLAFDKLVIIVKDDQTLAPFDTSIIEYLEYRRDLRHASVMKFKTLLAEKIKASVKAYQSPEHPTFLKHFGDFKVSSISDKEGSANEIILQKIENLSSTINGIRNMMIHKPSLVSSKKIEYNKNSINKIIDQAIDDFCVSNNFSKNQFISEILPKHEHIYWLNLQDFINTQYRIEVSLSDIDNFIKSSDLF